MKELEVVSHLIFLSDKNSNEYFSESAMLGLFHLKSLHLQSTKQKRLFLTLMVKCFAIWQLWELMEHGQKSVTEYTNNTNTKNTYTYFINE